jgi:hypothetical protein
MTTNSGAVTPQIAPVRCVVSTAASTPRTANAPYVVGVENMHLTAPVLSAVAMVENTRQIADARTAADTVDWHSNLVPPHAPAGLAVEPAPKSAPRTAPETPHFAPFSCLLRPLGAYASHRKQSIWDIAQ